MKTTFQVWKILSIFILLLSSCDLILPAQESTPDINPNATAVALTVPAELTRLAGEASPTPELPTAPPTLAAPSITPPPTVTPAPTETPAPTPTPTPFPCDQAKFAADVTIPDGTLLRPNVAFTKVWRLQNIGSCPWTTDYALVFVGGDTLGAKAWLPLPASVQPGEMIDLPVEMVTPKDPGTYRGYWLLRNARGVLFGMGPDGDESFWVTVTVREPARYTAYNFATEHCDADWESDDGVRPCDDKPGDTRGFVVFLKDPDLENRKEDEPTLWVHPNEAEDGRITGLYPVFEVEDGDRFRAWVGCLADAKGCRAEFQLAYQTARGGAIRILGTWDEAYDGKVTDIDLDLSSLAGREVRFILQVTVQGDNPELAETFWFMPRLDRIKARLSEPEFSQ
jgi:hypothetical protein